MRAFLPILLLAVLPLAGCLTTDDLPDDRFDPTAAPPLVFLEPVDLQCDDSNPFFVAYGLVYAHCGAFAEPVMEVAGDGTIWYSATCCVGQGPPIWTSRDGGQTFQPLPWGDGTGLLRDSMGVEGDFAIDDAGNVYFFDITAATAYFTKFRADGSHVHTKPDVFPPLVDRPWVRAGVEDEVFILYNTGSQSNFLRSTDGGLTWDRLGMTTFPCPLMALGQGPVRNDLYVAGCPGDPSTWVSQDGGVTWGDRIRLPLPEGTRGTEFYAQPAGDAAGNLYVPVAHTTDEQAQQSVISVYRVAPGGEVSGPWTVTDPGGLVDKPWSIAGKDGVFAMAYYAAEGVTRSNESEEAVWYLHVTYTLDGDTDDPTWFTVLADPDPVLHGTFGRNLGDFLQARQTPDDRMAVAYAVRDDGPVTNRFVQSDGLLDLGPDMFRNGPVP